MVHGTTASRRLAFDDSDVAGRLFGPHNAHLDLIGEKSGVTIDSRGTTLTLSGADPERLDAVVNLLVQLHGLVKAGRALSPHDIDQGWNILSRDSGASLSSILTDVHLTVSHKRKVFPKSRNQRDYLDAIRRADLVFGIGPAGTGKTYLAVAAAAAAMTARQVKRIILTRPAVEAGEKLGFLPGDLVEKVNPYLRPLYDALNDMFDFERVQEMLETGKIEIAPLAFMRGRTLNDAFIILDEAQNTTPEQMKMFLTRLGFNSKAVVTGDVTQVDLPAQHRSGLVDARDVLAGVPGLEFIRFDQSDVIRHPLVGRIVQAYERHSQEK